MISHFFSWGIFGIVLMVMALVHYVRRQPSFYWIYLILFLGPLGALIYLAVEWLPELRDPGAFRFVERGRRRRTAFRRESGRAAGRGRRAPGACRPGAARDGRS